MSDPRPAAPPPERYLGWGRLAAGVSLLVALATNIVHAAAWFEVIVVVGASGLVVLGARTLRSNGPRRRGRVFRWLLTWADVGVLGVLVAVGVDEDAGYVIVLLVLMLTLAALRGTHVYHVAVGVAVGAEVVRRGLQSVLGYEIDGALLSIVSVGMAVALSITLARMVELVRSSEREAVASAEAATAALAESERAASQLDVLHRVVASTIGAGEADALQQMVDEVATYLGVPAVTVLLADDGRTPRVVATTDPDVAARDDVRPVTRGPFLHGPLARALGGEPTRATDAERDQMAAAGEPAHGDVLVHPLLRASGQVVGAMACGTGAGRRFTPTEERTVARFAAQMGLAIEAARSLDREADLAARYRELDRLKTDFIAITSHELRTPLTTIVGVVETMRQRQDDLGPAEIERLVAALSRQAHRLTRLVDDLSTVSHVDAGTLTTVRRVTDVAATVVEAAAGLPEVDTELHLDDDLPCADADPDRLLQVVTNLVVNGDQHGLPPVHLQVTAQDDEVVLRVWDHGAGIPADRRDEVFERFVRLGSTETHSRGSGLGLAIARELVVAMRGTIEVVDHGDTTAFEARLPVHRGSRHA